MTVKRTVGLDAARWTGFDIGIYCSWFDSMSQINEARFYPDQLVKR